MIRVIKRLVEKRKQAKLEKEEKRRNEYVQKLNRSIAECDKIVSALKGV